MWPRAGEWHNDGPMNEATPPITILQDSIAAGRDALARHAWIEAYDQLALADSKTPLGGADLEGLAQASFFSAHPDAEIGARERAFKAYETAGDTQVDPHLRRARGPAEPPARLGSC